MNPVDRLYPDPTRLGYTVVREHDAGYCYDFDVISILRDERGFHYLIADFGGPEDQAYEGTTPADLTRVNTVADVEGWARELGWTDRSVERLVEGLSFEDHGNTEPTEGR